MDVKDQREERKKLEKICKNLASIIGSALPAGVAFAFILADFGQQGNSAYCSNAEREDMVNLLRETANTIEGVRN